MDKFFKIAAVIATIVLGGLGGLGGFAIIKKLRGKKVAFIGMSGSGKTTAVKAFEAVTDKNRNWKASDKPTDSTMNNDKYTDILGFKACIDTSGSQWLKKQWETTIKEVDWVFYFYDICRLNEVRDYNAGKTRYKKLVAADLKDINAVCQKQNKNILVIATHTDLEYDQSEAERIEAEFLKEIEHSYKYMRGSLKDYDSAKKLVEKINNAVNNS